MNMNRGAIHHQHHMNHHPEPPQTSAHLYHNHHNHALQKPHLTTITNVNSHPHRVVNKTSHLLSSNHHLHHNHNLNSSQGQHNHSQSRRKCPVHSTHSSGGSSSARSFASSSDSDPETSSFTDEIVEEKIYVTLKTGENLGCSVVRGPASYPGIFVQDVKLHGVAEASGLEIGDQIVGMNGFSFYPGHYNFDDAISKIKACQQMTLTVRKRVGIHFFPQFSSIIGNKSSSSSSTRINDHQIQYKQHKIRAIVHSPPSDVTSFHLPICDKAISKAEAGISSSEATDSDYDPEKDFDFGLESTKMPNNMSSHNRLGMRNNRNMGNNNRCKVHSGRDEEVMTPDALRRMQERLDEDRRQLQLDQIRLQEEMRRLVIERKELESLKKEKLDDGTISTTSSTSSSEGISTASLSSSESCCMQSMPPSSFVGEAVHSSLSSCSSSPSISSSGIKNNSSSCCNNKRSMESTGTSLNSSSFMIPASKSGSVSPNSCGGGSSSSSSSSSFPSSLSSPSSSARNTVTSSQMGFLDELKQLAEKRMSHSDGLLMDTLKKTVTNASSNGGDKHDSETDADNSSVGGVPSALKVVKQLHPDDEKRKQHELLMEEFRSAHLKMFGGKPTSAASSTSSTLINKNNRPPPGKIQHSFNGSSVGTVSTNSSHSSPGQSSCYDETQVIASSGNNSSEVGNKSHSFQQTKNKEGPVVSSKVSSSSPVTEKSVTGTTVPTTTVKILKTTKRSPPPPPPLPPSPSTSSSSKKNESTTRMPLVTITTYKSNGTPTPSSSSQSSSSSSPSPQTRLASKALPVKINLIRS